jgi:hypothetical protein
MTTTAPINVSTFISSNWEQEISLLLKKNARGIAFNQVKEYANI